MIGGLIGDVSDSAGCVDLAYGSWISSSPIDRLRVEPVVPSELLQARWTRVNLRVCSMLMAAIPESIRSDVVARKCNQSAPALLFRLHTTYQPGGGSEKALILKSLQQPELAKDPASAVKSLRDWIRWYNRCVDCNMSPPDTTVLSQSLTTITSQVLAHNEEAKFRTFLLRAMLKMDAQPTSTAVLEYHRHLLAACEALAVSKPAEATKPEIRALGTPNSPPGGKAGGQAGKPLCKFFLGASGCKRGGKCTYVHDMSGLTRQERGNKCLACGSEAHRQKDCPSVGAGSPKGQASSREGGATSPNKQTWEREVTSRASTQAVPKSRLRPSCGWCMRRPMLLHPPPILCRSLLRLRPQFLR